jgi:hypothetical protein
MDETRLIHAVEGVYIDYRISRGCNHASRDRHDPASSANVKVCSLCTETIAVQLIFVGNGQTEATSWMRSPNSFVLCAQIATAGPNRNFRRAVRPVKSELQITAMATPFNSLEGMRIGHSGHSNIDWVFGDGQDSTRSDGNQTTKAF